jgi:hypothetical protein
MYSMDEGERGGAAPRQLSGRGLAYWAENDEARVIFVTPGYRMVALDATTGIPVASFGDGGIVDLKQNADQQIDPDFYWMNLSSLEHTACGLFKLDSLNPGIGRPGDSCINFVTHLKSQNSELFTMNDADLIKAYLSDFKSIFGFELQARWFNIARVPEYSPILYQNFQNPPIQSSQFKNVYFAGNYRSFPSIVSTGSALSSGVETGQLILQQHGQSSNIPDKLENFRLRSRPKAGSK